MFYQPTELISGFILHHKFSNFACTFTPLKFPSFYPPPSAPSQEKRERAGKGSMYVSTSWGGRVGPMPPLPAASLLRLEFFILHSGFSVGFCFCIFFFFLLLLLLLFYCFSRVGYFCFINFPVLLPPPPIAPASTSRSWHDGCGRLPH